jgi:hypothetical protein
MTENPPAIWKLSGVLVPGNAFMIEYAELDDNTLLMRVEDRYPFRVYVEAAHALAQEKDKFVRWNYKNKLEINTCADDIPEHVEIAYRAEVKALILNP